MKMAKKKVQEMKLAGTKLRGDDLVKRKVLTEHWKPVLKYKWAAGVAVGRFLVLP